jgi:hypothetical protein
MRQVPQTKPMPENTAHLIQDPTGPDTDEFGELRQETGIASGLLSMLGNALGISPAKIANALGAVLPGKSKLNAVCKCGRRYKYFSDEGYTEDQSMCPPCRDEAMAANREAAMRPEKIAAQAKLREQEAQVAAKKQDERKEIIELVAETVSQVLAQKTEPKEA